MSRHATRYNHRDANEPAILRALAQLHVTWVEAGPLDGWIYVGQWMPVEIKNPDGFNRMRPGQQEFIAACEAAGRPYLVWRGPSDVIVDVCRARDRVIANFYRTAGETR